MIPSRVVRLLAILALAAALLWSGFLARLHLAAQATVLDRVEASLVDLRFLAAGHRPSPRGVLIVAVDDATARWAKAFPLPRDRLADLVSALFAGGAKAVGLDFLFIDPGATQADDRLAAALRSGPSVVAGTAEFSAAADGGSTVERCALPIPTIRRASAVGLVNIGSDRSGMVRHMPMLIACNGGVMPALPLRAASLAAGADPGFGAESVEIGGVVSRLDAGSTLALRFYGPEGTIETISAADVLTGKAPDAARGRTVLVGATASGTGDRYPTPFDTVLPGVEVLATAVANLQTGDPLVRTTAVRRLDALVAVALALAAVTCFLLPNIGLGIALFAASLASFMLFGFLGFRNGVWVSMAVPLAAALPVAAATAAGRLGLGRWTERRLTAQAQALAAFQAPALRKQLEADPNFLSTPVERTIAVVFIDISGFTGLTERLGPQPTRDILKSFHDLVEGEVIKAGGTVAAYMADGAMLVWGMASQSPDDPVAAVQTAIVLADRVKDWIEGLRAVVGPTLTIKLGGDFGPAILSRLGHDSHQHITAIGDTVNVASRLMKVAAEHESPIALSTKLLAAAEQHGFDRDGVEFAEPIDVSVRGRGGSVSVRLMVPGR